MRLAECNNNKKNTNLDISICEKELTDFNDLEFIYNQLILKLVLHILHNLRFCHTICYPALSVQKIIHSTRLKTLQYIIIDAILTNPR
jgi:hypothetical protein